MLLLQAEIRDLRLVFSHKSHGRTALQGSGLWAYRVAGPGSALLGNLREWNKGNVSSLAACRGCLFVRCSVMVLKNRSGAELQIKNENCARRS